MSIVSDYSDVSKDTDLINQDLKLDPILLQHKRHLKLINQILEASTINADILQVLKKLFNKGRKFLTTQDRKSLQDYGGEILEQLNLQRLMEILDLDGEDHQYSLSSVIQIFKYFVLNLQEKEYLDRILNETL